MVVDVEQSRGEDMPCAVENIRVVSDEITPAAAGPRIEDAIVLEGDKSIRTVNTRADQPDGVDDAEAALLTVSQLRCVLWPMALDNTLMVAGGLVLLEAVPDSTHGTRLRSRSEGHA